MSFTPEDYWYRQMMEQQRAYDRYIKPFEDALKQYGKGFPDHLAFDDATQRQIQDHIEELNKQKALVEKEFIGMSVVDERWVKDALIPHEVYIQDMRITDYEKQLLEQQFIEPPIIDETIQREIVSLREDIEKKFGNIKNMAKELLAINQFSDFESILKTQEEFYRLQEQNRNLIGWRNLPSNRVESILASAEAKLRILGPDDVFTDLTLSSIAEYQNFVDRQYKYLEHDETNIARRRIEVTELSGDLLNNINGSLDVGLVLNKSQESQEADGELESQGISSVSLYGAINQHIGIVYSNRFHGTVKNSFNKATPVRISKFGRKIIEKVYTINEICKRINRDCIFKPTNKTMLACSIIPSLITKNGRDFNYLVDQLYFLLYEGSGSAKRLDAKKHNSLLDPLWKVKHLRLGARHDIEHGKPKEIEQKNAKIGDAYYSLIQQPIPIKASDWIKTQYNLYTEINYMLQAFIQELVKN